MTKFPNYPTYKIRNEYSKLPGLDIWNLNCQNL
jgi:hypothetical protein